MKISFSKNAQEVAKELHKKLEDVLKEKISTTNTVSLTSVEVEITLLRTLVDTNKRIVGE